MTRIQSPLSRSSRTARGRSETRDIHPSLPGGPTLGADMTRQKPQLRPRSASKHGQQKYQRKFDYDTQAGAEPGIDPRRGAANAEYSHFKEDCIIDVIDYDDEDVVFERMGNEQFIKFLLGPGNAQPGVTKGAEDDLPPQAVRWINIEGIDWKVLSNVALRYNLDSLALEDILHERGHNHSKADYYPNHLFLRILCHTLEQPPSYMEEDSFMQLDPSSFGRTDSPPIPSPTYNAAEQGEVSPVAAPAIHALDAIKAGIASMEGGPAQSVDSLKRFVSMDTEQCLLSNSGSDTKGDTDSLAGAATPKAQRPKPFASLRQAVRRRISSLSGYHNPARREQDARLRELKKDHRVEIRKEPMFIFLLSNGTVISIHPSPDNDYTAPISERLHHSDSVLRTSADASLLVESLIDLIVDRILEVMDEYQMKIGDLERHILISPGMEAVRSLHILSGDLIMHKRTLDPIKTMIFGLRKYDLDRCIALHESLAIAKHEQQAREEKREHVREGKKKKVKGNNRSASQQRLSQLGNGKGQGSAVASQQQGGEGGQGAAPGNGGYGTYRRLTEPEVPGSNEDDYGMGVSKLTEQHARAMGVSSASLHMHIHGFLSYKSKVYLADVYDHMEFALTSLDMFADTTQNLLNYAFNTASYEMNIVMGRLTLITIIFLPLTLLTGYFGMNFEHFPTLDNSDTFFWKLAAPIMAVLIPLFMLSDIRETWRSWRRRRLDHQAIRELRRSNMSRSSERGFNDRLHSLQEQLRWMKDAL